MKIYSKITELEPNLLHEVVRCKGLLSERENVSEPHEYLQIAICRLNKGKTFRAHYHNHGGGSERKISYIQESWVVIRGSVKALYYDLDGVFLQDVILQQGDATITYRGGHNYEILEDDTVIYEHKNGPYLGIEKDKVFIE